MSDRKIWTMEEDQLVKMLREEQNIKKWSTIAKIMVEDHGMKSRTGKQCRQRYHNHLDSNILRDQWSLEEENLLYALHDQYGNKWALISKKLPGRTDNCVKNHFYSRMRKAVRKLNRIIYKFFKKQIKELKLQVVYKIIEAADESFQKLASNQSKNQELALILKRNLLQYSSDQNNTFEGNLQKLKEMAKLIHDFNTKYRKKSKNIIAKTKNNVKKSRNNEVSSDQEDQISDQGSIEEEIQEKAQDICIDKKEREKIKTNDELWKNERKEFGDYQKMGKNNRKMNMEKESKKIQYILSKEGMLKTQKDVIKNAQKNEMPDLSNNNALEEESHSNMLGQSIQGININDFMDDVEIDEENRLFKEYI